jgi:hypothetical protein
MEHALAKTAEQLETQRGKENGRPIGKSRKKNRTLEQSTHCNNHRPSNSINRDSLDRMPRLRLPTSPSTAE